MLFEIVKFISYSFFIVLISKYVLVKSLRNLVENLNLKEKTIGNIAGMTTSIPELLTITTASLRGFLETSIFNILSSNIINLVQYLATIIINRNIKKLKNTAIKTDIILVIITILIPIVLIKMNIKLDKFIIPLFLLLYVLFVFLNNRVHLIYMNNKKQDNKEMKVENINKKKSIINIIVLIISGVALYLIGNLLGNSLEILCGNTGIPESVIGIILGIITSIPELVTFFESQKHHKETADEMLGVVEATNNLFTSNILNLFIIQTIGILIVN